MASIRQALSAASEQLCIALSLSRREATGEARMLMNQALHNPGIAWLIAHDTDELIQESAQLFQSLLHRRLSGEPIAYIFGLREFYGLPLKVSPATLIPRPDTETLVEAALQKIPQETPLSLLDLGTGSGAIALAIAKQRPMAKVVAVDFSYDTLAVAQENATRLKLDNVQFRHGSWFAPVVGESFDVIVSNPPYIRSDDPHLKQGDLRFEPLSALAAGADGLDDIRQIVASAPNHLATEGWLMLEHGYDQAEKVGTLMKSQGFREVAHASDLAGIARVTLGQKA